MDLSVLGYQSYLLQNVALLLMVTKDPPISPRFSPFDFFIAVLLMLIVVQHSYNSPTNV